MAFKQWFFLLLPLVIILSIFLLFLPPNKDPFEILDSAKTRIKELDSFQLKAGLIMDLGIMGTVMRYISNNTVISFGNESHVHTVIQQPFAPELIINDKFITNEGNYSCTNNLLRQVCYLDFDIIEYGNEEFNQSGFKSVEFLGVKSVINRPCDAILAKTDPSMIQDVVSDYEVGVFSKVNNVSFYFCIDIETGLTLESLWTIIGESDYAGYLVETSINISKSVSELSFNITREPFILPFEVISEEEYWLLVNQTYDALSQDL